MKWIRALLRHGLFGIALAYVLAAQAMLVGPGLAATSLAQHELCVSADVTPDPEPHHPGGLCCLAACSLQPVALGAAPSADQLSMRVAVPVLYEAALLPSSAGHGPDRPAARGPPLLLV